MQERPYRCSSREMREIAQRAEGMLPATPAVRDSLPPGAMSFEDRIRQAVGRALDDVRTRMEHEVRALVQELAAAAAEERQLAMTQAREQTLIESRREADQRVSEAEAHLTATIDRVVADACAREREQASAHARRAFDDDADVRAARLVDATRALDAATSVNGVLDALAAAIGREAGRTGVFLVRGASFQGWALAGFGALDAQPARFDVPIAQAPLVQLAVQTGRSAVSGDISSSQLPAPTLSAEPSSAAPAVLVPDVAPDAMLPSVSGTSIAVPLIAAGHLVAIAYADALTPEGREAVVPRGWTNTIEVLARHAARCIAGLQAATASLTAPPAASLTATASLAAPLAPAATALAGALAVRGAAPGIESPSEASARRLARLLIEEIKLHNEPGVDEGRRAGNLLARLAPQIERARRVYDARVPVALSSRAQLFHQELVTTLADGDASRLGVSA